MELVKALLESGADVHAKDKYGCGRPLHPWRRAFVFSIGWCDSCSCWRCRGTALHLASSKGHTETVKALVSAGADMNESLRPSFFGSGSAYVAPGSLATLTRAFSWHSDMGRVIST